MHLLEKADMIISHVKKWANERILALLRRFFVWITQTVRKDPVQSLVASPDLCHLSEIGERRCTTNINSEANVNTELYTKTKEKRSNLIVKETKAEGAVKLKVCKKHFDMAVGGSRLGWWIICLLFCLYIVGQTVRVSIDLVFTVWSEAL